MEPNYIPSKEILLVVCPDYIESQAPTIERICEFF